MGITIAIGNIVPGYLYPWKKEINLSSKLYLGTQIGFGILVSRHIVTRSCETIPPLSILYMGILLLY